MARRSVGPRRSVSDRTLSKYSIAFVADVSGVPQQQLRRMEEMGLLSPLRTDGNSRRYSDDDLARIADVAELAAEGINAAGIRHILLLRSELEALRAEVERLSSAGNRNA